MKKKPSKLVYRFVQAISIVVSKLIFRCKTLRNEIKGRKGPFVVIANHTCALDFVNLIGKNHIPMTFVISNTFYNTLPVRWFMDRLSLIPKQQFHTVLSDLYKMKSVIKKGEILVIYPAGLMCEDGQSTPLPASTYDFLRWLKADIYMARSEGQYFTMPKWGKGLRPGKTHIDIFKIFDKDELESISAEEFQARTDAVLLFDSYAEQEVLLNKHAGGNRVEGLQNVLYQCPHCKSEFSIKVKGKSSLYCEECGFEQTMDKYGFFHADKGEEICHVSEWARIIYNNLKESSEREMSLECEFKTLIDGKRGFFSVGYGTVSLTAEGITLSGDLNEHISTDNFVSLPFSPGNYFELQHGDHTWRCYPKDAKQVMKFVNLIKIRYNKKAEA